MLVVGSLDVIWTLLIFIKSPSTYARSGAVWIYVIVGAQAEPRGRMIDTSGTLILQNRICNPSVNFWYCWLIFQFGILQNYPKLPITRFLGQPSFTFATGKISGYFILEKFTQYLIFPIIRWQIDRQTQRFDIIIDWINLRLQKNDRKFRWEFKLTTHEDA